MSYNKLCDSYNKTIALTSNKIFLPVKDPVYSMPIFKCQLNVYNPSVIDSNNETKCHNPSVIDSNNETKCNCDINNA